MNQAYTLSGTSNKTATVLEDLVIKETTTTRTIFRAEIIDNPKDTSATVKGVFVHQKKSTKAEWEDIDELKFNTLKNGEGAKWYLSCGDLKRLYDLLRQLYSLDSETPWGEQKYLVITDENKIDVIQQLLKQGLSEEYWQELLSFKPELAHQLAYTHIYEERKKVISEFEESLFDETKNENYWQTFFMENPWIFGYGLRYQFLNILGDRPYVGGKTFENKEGRESDFLLHTVAEVKSTVLVEIKTPATKLLEEKKYRNRTYKLEGEFIGAISQIQLACKTWEIEGSRDINNIRSLEDRKIYTYEPKGILVIGNTKALEDDIDRYHTFETFRQKLHNPEVITFDELLERAKHILGDIDSERTEVPW